MKKSIQLLLATALLFLTSSALTPQQTHAQKMSKGDNYLNVGAGFGAYGIPIMLSYENAITDNISLGVQLNYAMKSDINYKYTYMIGGIRGAYHFNNVGPENLDLYLGLMLGYNHAQTEWIGTGTAPVATKYSGLAWGGYGGVRYFFKPKIGIFGEVGYSIGWITAGVTFKF